MVTELYAKWQDYLFLTREMKKFLFKQDLDIFLSLVEQRESLQVTLEKLADNDYYASPEGKDLLLQVQQENKKMMTQFHIAFNRLKKQENVSHAYEGRLNVAGSFINDKT
ncbi:hypothetical protein SPSIL_042280 [Sporomusa silvacetica DSM 10669]|uniref:Flagellar protein FliT n=1 Tax=Sporomusa silvacetica DSM 10669 TaxID=1123289 RepID=A0ABZ3IRJ0_9FIRM|nr:hypothetical protein [Sporomusa silvacetica]OZC20489.1 hypothetical protein SPSIL_13570 [Sporomusa silvacetica DSM 10669]